jgi:hypothetical protein
VGVTDDCWCHTLFLWGQDMLFAKRISVYQFGLLKDKNYDGFRGKTSGELTLGRTRRTKF